MQDTYKIAFVLDDSLDKPDGVQQYILTLGQYLTEQGHAVHYIVGETKRTDIPNVHSMARNIKVRFNQNRMSIPLPASRKAIRELLAREEFDIIHVQMPYSPMLAGRVINSSHRSRHLSAIVGTFHIAPHSRLVHFANTLLRTMVSRSLSHFDEIISVSRVAQDFAWDTFRVESAVVPNTVRLESFYDAEPFPRYAKQPTIVFMGRLVERKGCRHLLRAVKLLHDQQALPDGCKVVICGTGPLEQQLKAYCRDNKLDGLVEFTGFVTEADKPRWLASGSVVVYPSTGGESFGIVLLEGMAATNGVVLAGDNPGYASVMGERPEVLFDPKDEVHFAAKLQKYLDDPALRRRAYEWQQQFVRRYDVPNVAEDLLVVYNQALHKRRDS